ncbi:hypothetical protein Dimus_008533 [Dionaea muscipula]
MATLESTPRTTIPQFADAITRIAVAQIAQSTGYRAAESSALESLTRLATLHLQSLAKSAAATAARSRRTQCNLLDIISALEDLSTPRGFPGASSVRHSLLSSGTIKELRQFVVSTRETPFAKRIPRRPRPECSSSNLSAPNGVTVRGPEVPLWLPAFPDAVGQEKVNCGRKEAHWEEEEDRLVVAMGQGDVKKLEKGKVKMLPWKRERVKFKLKGGLKKCDGDGGGSTMTRERICLGNCGVGNSGDGWMLKTKRRVSKFDHQQ